MGCCFSLGLLVLASLASAIRSQAGLPLLIAAVLVLVRRPWSGWSRAGAIALCLVAYLSVSTFGMAAARAERDHQLDGRARRGRHRHGHPFWHTTYIGLGYLPNDWDIRFYDGVAYRDVLREDPKAKFLGPAYGRILRDRYFKLVSDDPRVCGQGRTAPSSLVAMRPAVPALLVLALVGPWLLLVDARAARWRRDALFIVLGGARRRSPRRCWPRPTPATCWAGWRGAAGGDPRGRGDPGDLGLPGGVPRWCTRAPSGPRALASRRRRRSVRRTSRSVLACMRRPAIQDSAQHWHDEIPTPHVHQPPDATH